MSDLHRELENIIAQVTQRTPSDRETLKSIQDHLARVALRMKDVFDEHDRDELNKLHGRADALWNAAWRDALFPTILSTPERSTPDRPEPPERPGPWEWDGYDR